jgi:hypothetical protein
VPHNTPAATDVRQCHAFCKQQNARHRRTPLSRAFGAASVASANIKKLRERFFLERFVEAAHLPLEIVEQRESPDFLVRFENRVVGVEVTRLFVAHDANGPLPQAQESISEGIVGKARRLYELSSGSPAHVSITADALQELIDKKAQRLTEYQDSVRENWLLIVADGTKPSQLFEVRADFDAKKVSSPFARTFFYAYPERAIVELHW